MNEFSKRLTEISEILSYLPEEDLVKIPKEIRDTIEENKDKFKKHLSFFSHEGKF